MSDNRDLYARNEEYRIASFAQDDLQIAIYVYRGEWDYDESAEQHVVLPGDGIVVEIYDLCESEIWFQCSPEELRNLGKAFADLADMVAA